MKRVILESPFAGKGKAAIVDAAYKAAYLSACFYDCYQRGESPVASHALGPLALDDRDPEQRALGIGSIAPWRRVAEAVVVYQDLGISAGMEIGVQEARKAGIPIEYRMLGAPWRVLEGAPVPEIPEIRDTGDLEPTPEPAITQEVVPEGVTDLPNRFPPWGGIDDHD